MPTRKKGSMFKIRKWFGSTKQVSPVPAQPSPNPSDTLNISHLTDTYDNDTKMRGKKIQTVIRSDILLKSLIDTIAMLIKIVDEQESTSIPESDVNLLTLFNTYGDKYRETVETRKKEKANYFNKIESEIQEGDFDINFTIKEEKNITDFLSRFKDVIAKETPCNPQQQDKMIEALAILDIITDSNGIIIMEKFRATVLDRLLNYCPDMKAFIQSMQQPKVEQQEDSDTGAGAGIGSAPVSAPTPAPAPTEEPAPAPEPALEPAPEPAPAEELAPEPALEPAPTPEPAPEPAPTEEPAEELAPEPAPEPAPAPAEEPAPEPAEDINVLTEDKLQIILEEIKDNPQKYDTQKQFKEDILTQYLNKTYLKEPIVTDQTIVQLLSSIYDELSIAESMGEYDKQFIQKLTTDLIAKIIQLREHGKYDDLFELNHDIKAKKVDFLISALDSQEEKTAPNTSIIDMDEGTNPMFEKYKLSLEEYILTANELENVYKLEELIKKKIDNLDSIQAKKILTDVNELKAELLHEYRSNSENSEIISRITTFTESLQEHIATLLELELREKFTTTKGVEEAIEELERLNIREAQEKLELVKSITLKEEVGSTMNDATTKDNFDKFGKALEDHIAELFKREAKRQADLFSNEPVVLQGRSAFSILPQATLSQESTERQATPERRKGEYNAAERAINDYMWSGARRNAPLTEADTIGGKNSQNSKKSQKSRKQRKQIKSRKSRKQKISRKQRRQRKSRKFRKLIKSKTL
jgi:hypothetical protein